MVCLGIEPGVAGQKAQTNPLSYGGTPRVRECQIVWTKKTGNGTSKNHHILNAKIKVKWNSKFLAFKIILHIVVIVGKGS